MATTVNDDTIIPATLGEMIKKIMNPEGASNSNHRNYLDYVEGWVDARAQEEYKLLL